MPLTLHFDALLHQAGRLAEFEAYKIKQVLKGHKMDPITAIFNFLATPGGQLIVMDLHAAGKDIVTLLGNLMKHVHDKIEAGKVAA